MAKQIIIVNFEEIYLKGQNQKFFADRLREQLKIKLADFKDYLHFSRRHGGSIFIELRKPLPQEERELVEEILHRTPGVTGFYTVWSVPSRREVILEKALDFARANYPGEGASFRVTARRLKKSLPFTSRELAADIGALVVEHLGAPVNLTRPDWTLHVKVRPEQTFIYDRIEPGPGGLPVGSSGRGVAALSGGIDSPVAAAMMITRGMALDLVHFHSVPRTSPRSVEKVRELARVLSVYQPGVRLHLVPVLDIQQAIARNTDNRLRLVLLRRFMLLLAERLAGQTDAQALVTGDALGQVASQTLENMEAISRVTSRLVLRPLVALDKKEIIRRARALGTYAVSIQPHDDACAMFTPDNPETRARLDYVEKQWLRLDVEKLIEAALARMETEEYAFSLENLKKLMTYVRTK